MLEDEAACWDTLRPLLEAERIVLLEADQWTPEMREYLQAYFLARNLPGPDTARVRPGTPVSPDFDLIVRGICSLRPGVPGVSENIRVRSIVGRFLEHHRFYYFLNGGHEEMYIGSADLIERNLDRSVETLTPVRDASILEHLRDVVLGSYLRDTDRAMALDASGRYKRPEESAGNFNSQQFLLQHHTEQKSE